MYHDQVVTSLMKPLPNRTLINIASTGDRIVQSCYEAQNTSETGLGVEMAKLVILSLELLNKLLLSIQEDHPNAGELGKVISSSNEPHFLLIVAHYIYHLQTPGLALTSVTFLSSVATLFPMSLLACLGKWAIKEFQRFKSTWFVDMELKKCTSRRVSRSWVSNCLFRFGWTNVLENHRLVLIVDFLFLFAHRHLLFDFSLRI